jgi:hypothetical protein
VNRSLVVVTLLGAMLLAARAPAAESPDKLIEQGLHLRRDGRPAEALQLFRQAHALAPSPRTFGQMGLVEASLRQWVEGENHLSVSLANPDDPWVLKNRAFLDEALALCRRHVGDLVVSGAPGIEVFVAGRSIGTLPAVPALHLAEGTVTISASAPGFHPFERKLTIEASARVALSIALVPVPAAAATGVIPPPAPAAPTPAPPTLVSTPVTIVEQPQASHWHTWAGLTMATVGAAALGWGAVWIAINGKDDGSGNAYATRTPGWILAGAGAATLAGGIAILLTGHAASGSSVALGLTPTSLLVQTRF